MMMRHIDKVRQEYPDNRDFRWIYEQEGLEDLFDAEFNDNNNAQPDSLSDTHQVPYE